MIEGLVDALPVEDQSITRALNNVVDAGPAVGLFALIGALWTSSALISALRRGVGDAFDVDRGRPLVRGKLIDFTVLPVLGLMFLGSFFLTAAWGIIRTETNLRARGEYVRTRPSPPRAAT